MDYWGPKPEYSKLKNDLHFLNKMAIVYHLSQPSDLDRTKQDLFDFWNSNGKRSLIIGYSRLSSRNQTKQGRSIENQSFELEDYRCDVIITEIQSAFRRNKKLKNRYGLNLVIWAIESKMVKILAVSELNRISRNQAHGASIIQLLEDHQVKIYEVDRSRLFDLTVPEDKSCVGIALVESENYSSKLSRRIARGHRKHRDREACYHPIFGYVKRNENLYPDLEVISIDTIDGTLPITKWTIARQIVDLFLKTNSRRATVTWLNTFYKTSIEDGKLVKNQGVGFTNRGLRSWLSNPILAGDYCYNRNTRSIANRSEWLIIRDRCQALITRDEELIIINSLKENIELGGRTNKGKQINPFLGLVVCDRCKAKTKATNCRGRQYFICNNHHEYRTCANTKYASVKTIKEAVSRSIINHAQKIASYASTPVTKIKSEELISLEESIADLQSINKNNRFDSQLQQLYLDRDNLLNSQSIEDNYIHYQEFLSIASDPFTFLAMDNLNMQHICKRFIRSIFVDDGCVRSIEYH